MYLEIFRYIQNYSKYSRFYLNYLNYLIFYTKCLIFTLKFELPELSQKTEPEPNENRFFSGYFSVPSFTIWTESETIRTEPELKIGQVVNWFFNPLSELLDTKKYLNRTNKPIPQSPNLAESRFIDRLPTGQYWAHLHQHHQTVQRQQVFIT